MRPTYWRAMTVGRLLVWWWWAVTLAPRFATWAALRLCDAVRGPVNRIADNPAVRAYQTIRSIRRSGHTVTAESWDRYINGGEE